jgi:hypothetical protein
MHYDNSNLLSIVNNPMRFDGPVVSDAHQWAKSEVRDRCSIRRLDRVGPASSELHGARLRQRDGTRQRSLTAAGTAAKLFGIDQFKKP